MATIVKVPGQDGQAAVAPATEAAGGAPGGEFPALLAGATGAAQVSHGGERLPEEEVAEPVASGVLALVAAGESRRAPLPDVAAPPAGAVRASLPAVTVEEALAVRRDAAALPDPESPDPTGEAGDGQAAALPARTSPVAVAVLGALQAGKQPTPHDAVPTAAGRPVVDPVPAADSIEAPAPADGVRSGPSATPLASPSPAVVAVLGALQSAKRPAPQDLVPPAVGKPAVDPVPVADSAGLLADIVEEFVAADTSPRAEPDADGAPSSAASPAVQGNAVARDATAGAAHQRTLPGTVGTPAWRHALGAEVRLMIERGVGTATLRLSPEHLGPVEVRIDLADDSANVWFTASQADTRAALADALPRLRDMLASVGVNLGDAGVRRDLPGEPERRDGAWRAAGPPPADSGAGSRVVVTRLDAGRGMVDEYA